MVVHAKPGPYCCDCYEVKNPTFICEQCQRRVGYCMGGSEDELCSDCWWVNEQCNELECTKTPPGSAVHIRLSVSQ